MLAIRITPNLRVSDLEAARGFYTGFLGLSTEEFNLGWVARRHLAGHRSQSAVGHSRRVSARSARDLGALRRCRRRLPEASRLGFEIVHPLVDESWGVRRFLLRAPDGNVVNIVQHRG